MVPHSIKKRRAHSFHLFILIFVLLSCNQTQKKTIPKITRSTQKQTLKAESKFQYLYEGKFNLFQFLLIKEQVSVSHIEKKRIDASAGYGSAVMAAYSTIGIDFYPRKYYEKYKKDLTNITNGQILGSETDKYVLIKNDKQEEKSKTNINKNLRKELSIYFSELNLDHQEFETILNQIYNIKKETTVDAEVLEKFKEDLIAKSIQGYLEETDHLTRLTKSKELSFLEKKDVINALKEISYKIHRGNKNILVLKMKTIRYLDHNLTTATAAKKIISHSLENKNRKIAGIVLDLRDAKVSSLNVVQDFLSLFSSKPNLFTIIENQKDKQIGPSVGVKKIVNIPIAVLVNEKSIGASELIAGSLRENENAIIFGSKTYGKGTFQSLYSFEPYNGYVYEITIGKYILPSGYEIQGKGINPDVLLEISNPNTFKEYESDHWNTVKFQKNANENQTNPNSNITSVFKKNNVSNSFATEEQIDSKDLLLDRTLHFFEIYLDNITE
ncbi:S41 family peptidase [Leptospira mtsangambouensis]|nr:S41 family peptidase [Leptospira mtsangambouensis]